MGDAIALSSSSLGARSGRGIVLVPLGEVHFTAVNDEPPSLWAPTLLKGFRGRDGFGRFGSWLLPPPRNLRLGI